MTSAPRSSPRALRPRQLRGLALARAGEREAARTVMESWYRQAFEAWPKD